ncbi:MAG TPA: hypothetical protein DCF73_11575 [Rhodobiaceae bacterium]|nr:hypothetical protein [Rhodobiaceae bacterium]|tara:strand:- start:1785 stop:2753 length:969 start_codon:yes stop_codon:yes gene_type:complete
MKQMTISISSRLALTAAAFGAAIFLYAAAGAAPASAGSCGGGCTPPPPPPSHDCGCDGGGKGGGKNYNKNINFNLNKNINVNNNTNINKNTNVNNNTNNNTNNNYNENNIDVHVNVNNTNNVSATASAIANANAASDSASSALDRTSSVAIGNGSGGGYGGGGSSYYVSAPQAAPMGALNVVVRTKNVVKPVKAICVSAKGLEEAARMSTNVTEVGPEDDVELFHCVAGDMLVATIGRMAGKGDNAKPDYLGGYVIECRPGEALRHGSNGMLACVPQQRDYGYSQVPPATRMAYAEVLIRKNERGEEVSAMGGGFFSGGVGY